MAVEPDAAALRIVEARDELDGRRLAGAGGTDERGQLAGRRDERHVVERWARRAFVGEAHVLERDLAARRRQGPRVRPIADLDRQIEVLEDAIEERQRALHLD